MKNLKMLVAASAAAAALVAILGAGTASATVLCSTTADPCPAGQKWPVGTTLDWSIPSGQSLKLVDTSGNVLDTCTTSTLKWTITNAGSATETVTGVDEGTTFESCTFTTTTLLLGKTEIHKIAGTSNGTVTSDGKTEMTIQSPLGDCVYGYEAGVDLGTVTEGIAAHTEVNIVMQKFSGVLCPTTAKETGTYVLTAPTNTTLSVSSS